MTLEIGAARSTGLKFIVVCGLALAMTIPAIFVYALTQDRTQRAAEVVKEISASAGGEQTFLGPTLAIPYRIVPEPREQAGPQGVYLIFPEQGTASIKSATEERRRSLFKIPVFQAELNFDARFDLTGAPRAAPQGAELDWSRAEIVVGVADARGALSDAVLSVDGKQTTMTPAEIASELPIGNDQKRRKTLTLLGARVGDIAKPNAQFTARSVMRFSGAQRLAILAYGKTTQATIAGDWPSPGFDGGFLPARRTVSSSGFRAEWSIPFIARGVRAEGPRESMTPLDATASGVSFVEVADPYQSVSRSLKYSLLFVGLVFLSYFMFETTTGKRVHPAQYLLVGIAQTIFYVLLLSIAERVGFGLAFVLAGGATVLLLSINALWVFSSRAQGIRAFAIFSVLYGFIYTLLRLEDNALLIGALASFAAVAALMYLTRRIDWYGTRAQERDTKVRAS